MALESLLQVARQGTQFRPVNVTDGIAFPWKRLLRNTVKSREIIAGGITAVYALQTPHDSDGPQLCFCHPNSSYTCVCFRPQQTLVMHSKTRWQDLPVLQNATYVDRSWMTIRGSADGFGSSDPHGPRGPDRGGSSSSGGVPNSRLGTSSRGGDGPRNADDGAESAVAQHVPPPPDPLGPLEEV